MAVVTDYSTLQTAVADYLGRSDLTSFIPNFIQNAENYLYRTLNLRNEETALSVSITSGVAAVPSDFKALKFAYYDASPAQLLKWATVDEVYRDYPDRSSSGTPLIISREGTNFIFGPVSVDGTLKGIYYAKQDPLRTTDPSWYVTNAPEVLLYGSLVEAARFMRDQEGIAYYQSLLNEYIASLKIEEDNSAVSMGQLEQRPS